MEQIKAMFANFAYQLIEMLKGLGLDASVLNPIEEFFKGIFGEAK